MMVDPVAVVQRYLDAMAARDWPALRDTLAVDVVRNGPYRDDHYGRDAYVAFLESTFAWMRDYELEVGRVWSDGISRACAELSETVTLDDQRLRTDEAIVFDLNAEGAITRVQVFLQRSYDPA